MNSAENAGTAETASDGFHPASPAAEGGLKPASPAESELKRFHLLVEANPHALVVTDEAGRISLVNTGAERLFGYSRDELIGRPFAVLLPEQLHQKYSE